MPSKRLLAVALAAMVLFAGCSALPSGGGGGDADPEAPDYHGFTFVSDTGGNAYEATVTVEKDGERLLERSVSGDGDGTYVNLSSVEEAGPYTMTVNTTIPAAGGGNMSEQVELNGSLGNETVIDVSYLAIEVKSFALPRQEMEEPLYFQKNIDLPIEAQVVVTHDGETVYSEDVHRNGTGPFELAELPETGVYQVSVGDSDGENWENDTVILRDPQSKLFTKLDGDTPVIEVYPPEMPPPSN
ncbi:hypothetical protein [Halobacterium litoreum]|uniref:Uncharacterized protein n=1 Tax=Halobacterium litoreum TaxID=2039234 RepID=A0ABD5NEK2_9EURY|nr:hypothetical protein [Halobacterium litoreum]UHH13323.1 hypothetical protein LT972_14340 [Halobacterium litoreum]